MCSDGILKKPQNSEKNAKSVIVNFDWMLWEKAI